MSDERIRSMVRLSDLSVTTGETGTPCSDPSCTQCWAGEHVAAPTPATVSDLISALQFEGALQWYCEAQLRGVSEPCEAGSAHPGCHWRLGQEER